MTETTIIQMTGTLDPRDELDRRPLPDGPCARRRAHPIRVPGPARGLLRRHPLRGVRRADRACREPVTAARLRELTDAGLLTREPYQEPGQRTRRLYRLTEKGSDLLPALVALMQWGDKWVLPGGARVEIRHQGCGAPVRAELRCEHGHEVGRDELELARR